MKKLLLVFQLYNLIIATSMLISGLLASKSLISSTLSLLLLPLSWYFLIMICNRIPVIKHKISKSIYNKTSKIVFWYGFIISSLLLFSMLLNIHGLNNLLFMIILLPLVLYFLLHLISGRKSSLQPQHRQSYFEKIIFEEPSTDGSELILQPLPRAGNDVTEKDRRAFLKLVAGAGFGFLVTAIINPHKAGAAFFGSVPGPGVIAIKDTAGVKIDPAIKSPTDGYGIMNTDTTATPYYYGFVNKDGAWYIIKEVGDGSFLYSKGSSSYPWSSRASQTYAAYDTTF